MGLRRSILTATMAAAAVAQSIGAVGAQGNICLELEARLVQIERGGASPGGDDNLRQYDVSVAQQRNEIDRAMAEARRAGCVGGFLIFQRRAEAKCPQLMATIDQMRDNLQRLMRARGQYDNDPFTLARERNDILRSLAMNGCGAGYASNGGLQPERPRGLLESLFGQARFRTWGEDTFIDGRGFGTYRTLCVRTCDGYYFPISFSTIPAKFGADALACQQMCPGAEAVLYSHRNPGEDATAMVSLAGEPYSALPTAFRYRQEYDKSCTCRSATASVSPGVTEYPTDGSLDAVSSALDRIDQALASATQTPMPRLRPAPGEDPETAANRAGGLVPGPVAEPEAENLAGVAPDGRKIRIVGPASYYAP